MKKTVLIFDMDGVLVEPRRYRAALAGTMDYFGGLMGFDALYPGEETIAWFESRGIISEWDIAPLFLAAVFESILIEFPNIQYVKDLPASCKIINSAKILRPEIEYAHDLDYLVRNKVAGLNFCDLILRMNHENHPQKPFSNLSETPLFMTLFNESRNIHSNIITRVFQEIFLGKVNFENAFHIPVITENQNASLVDDIELISSHWKNKLTPVNKRDDFAVVIYTARPSATNHQHNDGLIEFSPEADLVIDQIGWYTIPVIGLGQLKYAADQIGCTVEDLIKPSPVHALGAIGTALTGNYLQAIQAGWDLFNKTETTFYSAFPELNIHIFEDSPTGVTGVIKAVNLLKENGIIVNLMKWGISSDVNKTEQLSNLGCTIQDNINVALDAIKILNP
jgi:hypothetical protein